MPNLYDRFLASLGLMRSANAIKVTDDNTTGYRPITNAAPTTTPWHTHRQNLEHIAKLQRTNPLAARIIKITTDYVIGAGIKLQANDWCQAFWNDPQNNLSSRCYRWCDELTRAGELFIVLSRNPVNNMSYIREIPAELIDQIETSPEDIERELSYHQITNTIEGTWWPSQENSDASQIMLHYTINKPIGETRGISDLLPIMPWLERYDIWLEDRVRINRFKSNFLWHVKIANATPTTIEAKRNTYTRPPMSGTIIVSDTNETWEAVQPNISADDAKEDGHAIRMMIAAGSGIPLHFLAESENTNRATAREMNQATYRHFAHRQFIFEEIVKDIIRTAAKRAGQPAPNLDIEFESVLTINEQPSATTSQQPSDEADNWPPNTDN